LRRGFGTNISALVKATRYDGSANESFAGAVPDRTKLWAQVELRR
jgi:hypothetical protein